MDKTCRDYFIILIRKGNFPRAVYPAMFSPEMKQPPFDYLSISMGQKCNLTINGFNNDFPGAITIPPFIPMPVWDEGWQLLGQESILLVKKE